MSEKLKPSGIESIGDVPWGTHFSQIYENKEDLINIVIEYFKAGLDSNECCLWISSDQEDRLQAEEALRKAIPNYDECIESGRINVISYRNFYLENHSISTDKLLEKWIALEARALAYGYEGIRAWADKSWLSRSEWETFMEHEKCMNRFIEEHKLVIMCTYSYEKCGISDVIDIIQNHQPVIIKKNNKWTLVESTNLKNTKKKLERVNRLYAVLSKINHAIIRIEEPRLLYTEACRIAVEDGLFKAAWIGTIDKDTSVLEPVVQWGFNQKESDKLFEIFTNHGPMKGGVISTAISSGKGMISNNIQNESRELPWHENVLSHDIQACAIFPLKVDGKIIGIMAFYSTDFFSEEQEINLLESLCDDISFAVSTIEKEKLRKQMEEDLRQSEERYRKIFELSPTAILVHSQFVILYANLAAAKLLKASSSNELIGENILKFIHKDCHHLVIERRNKIKQLGVALPFEEEKYVRLDGKVIDVEASGTLFPYKDKSAMVSVVRDITEKKKLEQLKKDSEKNKKLLNEAREYDKLRTEFFANISHELRTPINVILSAIQLLNLYTVNGASSEEGDKINKYIYTMQQNCYRLLRLVSNIIDITKIDAGFFELQLENYNVVNVIEDITLSISEYTEHKGINLLFDTDIEEKVMACDGDKLDRVMLNLLSNAVKFTKPGGVIEVNIHDKGDRILISVKDTGIGIPSDKKDLVFERFQQVDKSLTRSHEGSGIGLSIVRSLIELHGGTISVESEYGAGTEFIIELPVNVLSTKDNTIYNTSHGENIEKINIEFSDIYS